MQRDAKFVEFLVSSCMVFWQLGERHFHKGNKPLKFEIFGVQAATACMILIYL
jgi:hypothetical protein